MFGNLFNFQDVLFRKSLFGRTLPDDLRIFGRYIHPWQSGKHSALVHCRGNHPELAVFWLKLSHWLRSQSFDARADSLFHANWLLMSVGFMSDESSKGIIRIFFQMQEGIWIIWKNMRPSRNRCQIMSFFHGWRQLVFAGNTCQLSHLAFASKPLLNEVKVHGGDKQGHCQCHCWRSYRRSKWKCFGEEEISIMVVTRVASSHQG